jgi:hypothetical protein
MGRYQVSERRAAMTARFHRSSLRYQSRRDPQTALRQRLRELAQTRGGEVELICSHDPADLERFGA